VFLLEAVVEREDQVFLRRHVVVSVAERDAGRTGDRPHPGALVPALTEQLQRGGDDRGAGLLAAGGARGRAGGHRPHRSRSGAGADPVRAGHGQCGVGRQAAGAGGAGCGSFGRQLTSGAVAQRGEYPDVDQVQHAEGEQHDAQLQAEGLDDAAGVEHVAVDSQEQRDEAESQTGPAE